MKKILSLLTAISLILGVSLTSASAATNDEDFTSKKMLAKISKAKRMKFIRMIIDSKKECKNMHGENKKKVKECFRGKIRDGIKERAKRLRDTAKKCKEQNSDLSKREIKNCALKKYLNIRDE
jgi:hypothetical protein